MFKWAEQYVTGITFFFVSADDVVKNAESFGLDARYSVSKTVTGTRSHHSLVPVSVDEIKMRRVSADENFSYVFIGGPSTACFTGQVFRPVPLATLHCLGEIFTLCVCIQFNY
ncbi:hypothetical protein GQR58_013489 [Nymphon striatum]|nr:hypothetical protein GQR58_013489 [Nymphon striatum]